jgi:CSLREA domain-containing protein
MSPSPFLCPRVRTRSVISICILCAVIALAWTSRQQAGVTFRQASPVHSATLVLAQGKGSLSPQATGIIVNSTSDTTNASDGLCTLREAITAANGNVASGSVAGECAAGNGSGSDPITFSVTGATELYQCGNGQSLSVVD